MSVEEIMMREYTIDSGKGGDPVVIAQLSDFHINYCDDADTAEANPTIEATRINRFWLADAVSVERIRPQLAYAATWADQMVVTGDALDYLSIGALRLLKEEVWDKYPGILITNGNHDYIQVMSNNFASPTIPMVAETKSLEERYAMMQAGWSHDVIYTSKVVKDKVLVVAMDNGRHCFLDEEVEPLKRDIALAREKGYTVLLFFHESVYTNNPAEEHVDALRADDHGWEKDQDFYRNSANHFVGSPNDPPESANARIMDLIFHNADVIKGVFNGHAHEDFYTEIAAYTPDGEPRFIPQVTMTGSIYGKGHIVKITVV